MSELDEKKKDAIRELQNHSPDTLEFIKQVTEQFGKPESTVIYVNKKLFVFE